MGFVEENFLKKDLLGDHLMEVKDLRFGLVTLEMKQPSS